MFKSSVRLLGAVVALVVVAACTQVAEAPLLDDVSVTAASVVDGITIPSDRYLLLASGSAFGRVLLTAARNGDTVERAFPEAGFAVLRTAQPEAYSRLAQYLARDLSLDFGKPGDVIALDASPDAGHLTDPPSRGVFGPLTYGVDVVHAPQAWEAGVTGAGATVAVLDTGFDLTHPDLVDNINFGLSIDFTGEGLQYTLPDPFSHGSHVAGTIAATGVLGVAGVAPRAELVLVKVLEDEGSGSFADVFSGIVYAAIVGADVINMSLGAVVPQRSFCDDDACYNASEVAQLRQIMNRIVAFAHQSGALVITSAGNAAIDRTATRDLIVFPADTPHAVSIAATAPVGFATLQEPDFDTDFDLQASYTNHGRRGIDFAAPGGDFVYPGDEDCTLAGLIRPCWVFDLVFSTGHASWYWSAGTSMAAPHASGVAALIIAEHGGALAPSQVERELRERAMQPGGSGRDPAYGMGRVSSGH